MGETGALCEQCGLCCDGTLFGKTVVYEDELEALVQLGFAPHHDGEREVMPQPCRALRRTRCQVYAQRPRTCVEFTCELYKRLARDDVTLPVALALMNRAKAMRENGSQALDGYLSRTFRTPPDEVPPVPEHVIEPPSPEDPERPET